MTAKKSDLAAENATIAGPLRIGIGCMALTGLYGQVAETDSHAVLEEAIELGFQLFDTAPLYANGDNERLLGDVIGSRSDIVVSTKFGLMENRCNELMRDSRPSTIRASVETSLHRLRRERIDILIQHRPDPDVDDQEVAGAVQELIDEGKVAAFGLSGTTMDRIKQIAKHCPVSAVQNDLSLLSDPVSWSAPEKSAEMGAFFMAYAPIARGLLNTQSALRVRTTGDYRSQIIAFDSPNQSVSKQLRSYIDDIAENYNVSATAVVVNWVRARGTNVVPIPGPRHTRHLPDLIAAATLQLTAYEISTIEELSMKKST
jgi:aryl-alcohol dehydrogenase-like predicted oxidoreductase